MDDIYSWILSPEIREYLRGRCRPDLLEKQALIRSAYRPIEKKLSALQKRLREAETEEEQTFLEKVVETYRLAIREIRLCRRNEFYLCRTALQFGGDSGLYAYPFNYLGEIETEICRSYEELSGGDPSVYCPVSYGYTVEKWRAWKPALRFDLKPLDGAYWTTEFYLDDVLLRQAGLTRKEWERGFGPEELNPYPLPFSTGDLVCLDPPLFERPVYGALCDWTSAAYDGERFTLLGYIENGRFRVMDLSGRDIAFGGSGYRVIDWLRRASAEELPAGLEILGEIGARLRSLNRRDWTAAKDQFLQIFVQRRKKAGRTSAD